MEPACAARGWRSTEERPASAANGNPEAMPLERVTRSGSMPNRSEARKLPVRPPPVSTSSATSRTPFSRALSEICSQ